MSSIIYILEIAAIVLYMAALSFILLFSLTQVHLLLRYIFFRSKYQLERAPEKAFETLPFVTVQLPIYNEKYVAERLLDCVAKLNYPKERLEIQVLDDSTDETRDIILDKIRQFERIINIAYI